MKRTTERHNSNESFEIRPSYGPNTRPCFEWEDRDHTPYNKRHGQVKSWATLKVEDEPKGDNTNDRTKMSSPLKGWLNVQIEEVTTSPTGHSQSRTISVTLSHDARIALINYLKTGLE